MTRFYKVLLSSILFLPACDQQTQEESPELIRTDQSIIDSLYQEVEKKEFQLEKLHRRDSVNEVTYDNIFRALRECKESAAKAEQKENFPLQILTTFPMHRNDFDKSHQKRDWIGLFRGNEDYVEKVDVKFIRVHDPFTDYGQEKSGWKPLIAGNQDSCMFLIAGLNIEQRSSAEVISLRPMILPGEAIEFDFLSHHYRLRATGEINEWNVVSDYKLYLQINKEKPQLLISEQRFDDDMIDILWTGDINQDGLLDLIIDTSNHYNVMEVSLFLSSGSGTNKLLKKVAVKRMVGC